MSVEFLVKARAKKHLQVGEIAQTIKPAGSPWGGKEGLPDFIIFRVTNANRADILPYTIQWIEEFEVEEKPQERWIRPKNKTKVNHIPISQDHLKRANLRFNDSAVKPNGYIAIPDAVSKAEIEEFIADELGTVHKNRRYRIDPTYMKTLVLGGNDVVEMTLAQFIGRVIDGADNDGGD